VLLLAIMHIRQPLEARGEPPLHRLEPIETLPDFGGTARHLQPAVLAEIAHDPVDIVRIEPVA